MSQQSNVPQNFMKNFEAESQKLESLINQLKATKDPNYKTDEIKRPKSINDDKILDEGGINDS